jgi:hypothetical protein
MSDSERKIMILEKNWILENEFVTIEHSGEKMILNDSLTMIWMEIDGASTAEDIADKIYNRLGGNEDKSDVIAVVQEGLKILETEGIIAFEKQDLDDWFGKDFYA